MSRIARYLTHPQVQVDPLVPVPEWSLNAVGHARVAALAATPAALGRTNRIISSAEVKALQTAHPLADALGLAVETRPAMHENDRSATGFLPPDEFERVADQFFAHPTQSVRGWETAQAAQARILAEVDACLAGHAQGDVLFVGHGGVGTLLYCALAGQPIDRRFDQGPGGGGCWFEFDIATRKPASGWQPIETLLPSLTHS
ncbi:histidine phosphatase family protein [Paracoccus laeviglucosivorans]|uniref:Broad specificity phosphatase PhoE n=1 Tax=Paracoccus laeviglucosivorans TaxID=1197861 RepID=A0A521AC85_9RHOB|nr:histidine phosphatase family protein [Paracoccus laeviglucosivorans]SMO32419.1 Broad specificity phosphatase PhoE [Paracoccus laeviglucosivorans]